MTKAEEIEFDRVLNALDVARYHLRELKKMFPYILSGWVTNVLAEIDAAEGAAE